jgi:hypothetical protein
MTRLNAMIEAETHSLLLGIQWLSLKDWNRGRDLIYSNVDLMDRYTGLDNRLASSHQCRYALPGSHCSRPAFQDLLNAVQCFQPSCAAYPCPSTPGHVWLQRIPLLAILGAANHLSQLVFLGELAKYCFLRSDLAIGLNAKLERREERMRDLKRSQHFLEVYREEQQYLVA